jgi:hypothetical protein
MASTGNKFLRLLPEQGKPAVLESDFIAAKTEQSPDDNAGLASSFLRLTSEPKNETHVEGKTIGERG